MRQEKPYLKQIVDGYTYNKYIYKILYKIYNIYIGLKFDKGKPREIQGRKAKGANFTLVSVIMPASYRREHRYVYIKATLF